MIQLDTEAGVVMAKQENWYPLRMDEELRAQVKAEAEREQRSMNAMLLIRLRHSYATSDSPLADTQRVKGEGK